MHGGGKKYFENRLMKRAVLRVTQVDSFTDRRRGARGSLDWEAGAGRRKDYKGRGRCGFTTVSGTLDGQTSQQTFFVVVQSKPAWRSNGGCVPPVR